LGICPTKYFFFAQLKIIFAKMGKNIDPFLAIFFCPTNNLTAATPLGNLHFWWQTQVAISGSNYATHYKC
jgi:hypothetical protein